LIGRKGSPYEVRCPRCDVSFPVETRRCVHCGGPTVASDAPPPIAVDTGATTVPGSGSADAVEVPEEPAPGLGATLLRTFGSLFWVIALVAFSILRSCGED
jgi:hypothetical protein